MIDRLVTALRAGGRETVPVEVAEALWLARYARGAVPHILAEAADLPPGDPSDPADPSRRPRQPRDQKPEEEPTADVYPDTEPADDTTELGVGGPRIPALRGTLGLGRALRPLRRRQPSRHEMLLDEALTADRIAQEGLWLPAWRPVMERRFRATVLIDSSASMLVWRRTVGELMALLGYVGAFRTVRAYMVDTDDAAMALRPGAISDPARRQLIIVITDGIGAAWGDGRMPRLLEDLAAVNPVQVINLLPRGMWRSTAMATGRPRSRQDISVAELSETAIGVRAKQLADDQPPTGPVLTTAVRPSPLTTAVDLAPAQRVQQFVHNASPAAQRLANCLAAAPLTFPVMRLVQHVMLPETATIHLAEVFVSGLLRRRSDPGVTDPDLIAFDFLPGVRDQLLDIADRYDTVQVLAEVSRFVGDRLGQPFDFPAYLAHPDDPLPDLGEGALPFARVSATVLRRLGPRYTGLADRLDEIASAHTVVRPTQPTRPSDALEGYPLSGSGTRAVFIGMDSTAPADLAEVLIAKYALRPENAVIVDNPLPTEIIESLERAVAEADDVLIVCISGKSRFTGGQTFLLTPTESPLVNHRLDLETIRALVQANRARRVSLILESDTVLDLGPTEYLSGFDGLVAQATRLLEQGDAAMPTEVTLDAIHRRLWHPDALYLNPDGRSLVFGPNPALADEDMAEAVLEELGEPVVVAAERPRHLFISYARSERDYASRLADHLQQLDIPVWMDSVIAGGENWRASIESALRDSAAMVVVVSPAAAQSDWVRREIDYMRAEDRPVLALRTDEATQAPPGADEVRTVIGGQMPDAAFVDRVRQHLGMASVDDDGPTHMEPRPVFYLSYASVANSSTERVRRLFNDLRTDVSELVGLQPGQLAGFMDRGATAADWRRDALPALNSCQVFVPLLSGQYFRSAFCITEWNAFAQRRVHPFVHAGPVASAGIVPVLWAPIPDEVPAEVGAIQRFLPSGLPEHYQALYASDGLLGMGVLDRDAYRAVVWKLAQTISRVAREIHVEPGRLTSFDGLSDRFGGLSR